MSFVIWLCRKKLCCLSVLCALTFRIEPHPQRLCPRGQIMQFLTLLKAQKQKVLKYSVLLICAL